MEHLLVGTWLLLSFEMRYENAAPTFPWGPRVTGQLIYTADGYMAGAFMKQDRGLFRNGDIMGGTPEEFKSAMVSYIGYSGTYGYHHPKVVHRVQVSLYPNWSGTDVERIVEFDEDTLTLTTPPLAFAGNQGTGTLIWKRG